MRFSHHARGTAGSGGEGDRIGGQHQENSDAHVASAASIAIQIHCHHKILLEVDFQVVEVDFQGLL